MVDESTDITMAEESAESLDARVARLERQTKRLRLLLGLAALAWVGTAALCAYGVRYTVQNVRSWSKTAFHELATQQLTLVEKDGKMRARLSVDQEGQALIKFWDRNGTGRASLGAGTTGGALVMTDEKEKPRLAMATQKDGTAFFTVGDDQGNQRVVLSSHGKEAGITLYDERKIVRGGFGVSSDDLSRFSISNGDQNAEAELMVSPSGDSTLALKRADGPSMGMTVNGRSAKLLAKDQKNKTRGSFGIEEKGATTLSFLDQSGKEKAMIAVDSGGTVVNKLGGQKTKGAKK